MMRMVRSILALISRATLGTIGHTTRRRTNGLTTKCELDAMKGHQFLWLSILCLVVGMSVDAFVLTGDTTIHTVVFVPLLALGGLGCVVCSIWERKVTYVKWWLV